MIVSLCGIQIVLRDAILRRMVATPETACRIREVQHTRTWWHVETKDIDEHISVVRDTGRHNRARVQHLFDHTLHVGPFGLHRVWHCERLAMLFVIQHRGLREP